MPIAVVLLVSSNKTLRKIANMLGEISTYFKGIVEVVVAKTKPTKGDIERLVDHGVRKVIILPIVENLKKNLEISHTENLRVADGKIKIVYANPMIFSSRTSVKNLIIEIEKLLKP
ncbi:MAG: hypothetical protein DRO23_10360 [Thermoprotei archaeon]|nr:MAG: hypothetical protein DRO23_10360 [Thermoprotei archaeon]